MTKREYTPDDYADIGFALKQLTEKYNLEYAEAILSDGNETVIAIRNGVFEIDGEDVLARAGAPE